VARRLLIGRAGTGKTHACLDLLTESLRARGHPLLVVPTYGQAEHLRTLLLDRAGGIAARCVETFSSLAERVLGRLLSGLASAAARDLAAEAVLSELFPAAAAQPGFRAEFLAAVKEAKDQGLCGAEAVVGARAHFADGSRGRLFFEAFERYERALPGLDHEDLLLRTRDALAKEGPDLDLLLFDGFHDFTPVQREIIERLSSRARETIVTLPLDPEEAGDGIFATAARTARSFDGYERRPLRGNRRARGALASLEQRLFREPGDPVAAEAIEVWACASEEDEADRLARQVKRSGRPYEDFLLLRRTFDGVHALYRAAFARHGVPLRFFGGEPVGETPAARAAILFLRSLAGPLPDHDRIALLRSPYLLTGPAPEEVDALAAALRTDGRFEAAWQPPSGGALAPLLRRHLGVQRALLSRPDGDRDLASASRLFATLLDEAEALRGLALPEAALRLARRIPLLRGGAPDRRHACVYAVEAMDARQWEKPVVLVAGLDAGHFPRPVREDLFLRDDERRALATERSIVLPPRIHKEEEERYLFYVALTRAREAMVLSYAAFDEEGVPRAPSPYLDEALSHFRDLRWRKIPLAQQYAWPEDVVSSRDLLPIVADGLSRTGRGEGALAAALHDAGAVERPLLAWPRRLELLRTRPIPALGDAAVESLSASSINAFLRCPYLLLMRRVLAVEPPRERELDPQLRGTIMHRALERAAAEREGDAGAIFDEVFAEETRALRLGLGQEAQRRWMRSAVVRAAGEMREQPVECVEHPFRIECEGVTLRGQIDRIDRLPQGAVVRDYKSGKPDLKAALALEDIQLDLYLLALPDAVGALFERLRVGDRVGFLRSDLPGGKGIESLTAEELDARRERTRRIVRETAERARRGALAVAPRDPESCTRTQCDGYDLCRVARARWLERRAREAPG